MTAEPIDLCLAREIITEDEHRSGLHLRWLHTLRYGAPRVSMRYTSESPDAPLADDPTWRALREREYAEAVTLLHVHRRHDAVIRLAIYNELPLCLNPLVARQAWDGPSLQARLDRERQHICEGLKLLAEHWKR